MNGRRGGKWGNAADAGRSPLCALALYRGKKGDLKGVRRALEFFVQHHDALNKERGKALVHAGPQGQGSHFISFDYAYAAAAVRLLPKNERAAYRSVLLEDILGARLADGSYTEQPWFGRGYATAMALMAFQELTEGRGK